MMLKVGKDTILPHGSEISRRVTYKDVHCDIDGWADSSRFMPADFDLVYLKLEGKKSISGWSTGTSWDGLKLNKDDKVLYWKRKPDEVGAINDSR